MNWKTFYRRELKHPAVRSQVEGWLSRRGDSHLLQGVETGGVPSFPHTALRFAGPLQARVADAVISSSAERILALGVAHGTLVEPIRRARDEATSAAVRREAFLQVRGGIFPAQTLISTPFGDVPTWAVEERAGLSRRDRAGWLSDEFSLDTFAAVCRACTDLHGRRPIPILPLYVGLSRDPRTGRFDAATELAEWLRDVLPPATAVVTTGDLVHYGTAYGLQATADAAGETAASLEARFSEEVKSVLDLAFREHRMAEAYHRSAISLQSDQREILPVIVSFLPSTSCYEVTSFALSDYSGILSVPRPCLVASALAVYGGPSAVRDGIEPERSQAYPA